MLGDRIRMLRQRQGLDLGDLAARSKIAVEVLSRLERNEICEIPHRDILSLAIALGVRAAHDFGHLLSLNGVCRRFRAYNVGRPKTGTTSVAHIFSNYRSRHEFKSFDMKRLIGRHIRGEVSDTELRTFVLQRDSLGGLEMDSSSFNHYYLDILVAEFPWAKYVFTIRDCYSWVDSVTNFALMKRRRYADDGAGFDAYMVDEDRHFYSTLDRMDFGFPPGKKMDREQMVAALPDYIDAMLTSWTDVNGRILSLLPPENSLILRTHEITSRLDDLARFIGVPRETLNAARAHSRKGTKIIEPLRNHDPGFLMRKFEQHCGPLMERFFPGYAFRDYLEGRKPPPASISPLTPS